MYMSVGVMKDYKLKLRKLRASQYTGLVVELEHLKTKTRLIDKELRVVVYYKSKARAKESI